MDEFNTFDKSEKEVFEKLLTMASSNKSAHYQEVRGSTYSFDTDGLCYIDSIGTDMAYGGGAEQVAEENLSKDEIDILFEKGFVTVADGESMYAFTSFLMLKFIEGTVLLKAADRAADSYHNSVTDMLKSLNDAFETNVDIEGELSYEALGLDVKKCEHSKFQYAIYSFMKKQKAGELNDTEVINGLAYLEELYAHKFNWTKAQEVRAQSLLKIASNNRK